MLVQDDEDKEDDNIDDIETILYGQIHYASSIENVSTLDDTQVILGYHGKDSIVTTPKEQVKEWYTDENDSIGGKKLHKYERYYISSQSQLSNIFCYNCDRKGHLIRDCTEPKKIPTCHRCGRTGHNRQTCPNDICYNCKDFGHIARNCNVKKRRFNSICQRCGIEGHDSSSCTEIWRQYFLTVVDGPIIKPRKVSKCKRKKIGCCYCASSQHYEDVCENIEHARKPLFSPFITTYDEYISKLDEVNNPNTSDKQQTQQNLNIIDTNISNEGHIEANSVSLNDAHSDCDAQIDCDLKTNEICSESDDITNDENKLPKTQSQNDLLDIEGIVDNLYAGDIIKEIRENTLKKTRNDKKKKIVSSEKAAKTKENTDVQASDEITPKKKTSKKRKVIKIGNVTSKEKKQNSWSMCDHLKINDEEELIPKKKKKKISSKKDINRTPLVDDDLDRHELTGNTNWNESSDESVDDCESDLNELAENIEWRVLSELNDSSNENISDDNIGLKDCTEVDEESQPNEVDHVQVLKHPVSRIENQNLNEKIDIPPNKKTKNSEKNIKKTKLRKKDITKMKGSGKKSKFEKDLSRNYEKDQMRNIFSLNNDSQASINEVEIISQKDCDDIVELGQITQRNKNIENDLDFVTLNNLEKILQSDSDSEEDDAIEGRSSQHNSSVPTINLSDTDTDSVITEDIFNSPVSNTESEQSISCNVSQVSNVNSFVNDFVGKTDMTRYDPAEILQEGLAVYGLINDEKAPLSSPLDGMNRKPFNKPKKSYKTNNTYQWNPFVKKLLNFKDKRGNKYKYQKKELGKSKKQRKFERQQNVKQNKASKAKINSTKNTPSVNINRGFTFNFY